MSCGRTMIVFGNGKPYECQACGAHTEKTYTIEQQDGAGDMWQFRSVWVCEACIAKLTPQRVGQFVDFRIPRQVRP